MQEKTETAIKEIEEYINNTFNLTHSLPSISMIGEKIGKSKSHVHKIIKEMVDLGLLFETDEHKYITKKISKIDNDITHVAIVGSIACGEPILAEENIESYVSISSSLVGSGEYFILKAEGNSMINAGINDGDLVLIRKQNTANEGDIVVALIDNEATLKRFYIDKLTNKIRLHPENDDLQDMYFDNIIIQGIAKKVIKGIV